MDAVELGPVRRQLSTVTLVLVALVAALAVWAGLSWASGGFVAPPSRDFGRIVFTQATDPSAPGGPHRCHNGGGPGNLSPAPASAAGASASV